MQREAVVLGGAVVASLTIGAASGYFFAKKKFESSYEEVIAKEIKEAKEFYSNLYKTEYPTPESAAEALLPTADKELDEATTALRSYLGQEVEDEGEKEEGELEDYEVEEKNIFDNGDDAILDPETRDHSKPYVISYDEYMQNEDEYDQTTFTWYEGDSVLADERDEHIPDVDSCVGQMNMLCFGVGSDDPNVVLIRNERLKQDFEVTRSEGKYSHEVLGLDAELKHSDDSRRSRRPNWDD